MKCSDRNSSATTTGGIARPRRLISMLPGLMSRCTCGRLLSAGSGALSFERGRGDWKRCRERDGGASQREREGDGGGESHLGSHLMQHLVQIQHTGCDLPAKLPNDSLWYGVSLGQNCCRYRESNDNPLVPLPDSTKKNEHSGSGVVAPITAQGMSPGTQSQDTSAYKTPRVVC